MESFKDAKGQPWDLLLTIGVAKKIKSRHKLDIIGGDPSVVVSGLLENPLTRTEVMWLMVDNPDGRTSDDFDDALGAGSFKDADAAFWKEFGNFIQAINPNQAEAIARLIEKYKEISAQQVEVMIELAEDPETVAAMERVLKQIKEDALKEIAGMASTILPESSESTQTL